MSIIEHLNAGKGHWIDDVRRAVEAAGTTELASVNPRFLVVANITAPFSLTLLSAEGQSLLGGQPRASEGRATRPLDTGNALALGSLPKELSWAVSASAPIKGLAAYLLVGDKVRKLGWRSKALAAGKVWRSERLITANLLGD